MQSQDPPVFFLVLMITFVLALIVLIIASWWKIFEKAGKPGWAAVIPIYNIIVMLEVAGKPGWWAVFWFIPLVNYIFMIWTYNMVSKSFGKDEAFTIGLVMLGIVFWPILAFGDAEYEGPFGLQGVPHTNQPEILDSNI